MFFWPIWTKSDSQKSERPFWPTKSADMPAGMEASDSDDKMFFWPIWTKTADMPAGMEASDSDDKMFFWPIWTKSDSQESERPLVIILEIGLCIFSHNYLFDILIF